MEYKTSSRYSLAEIRELMDNPEADFYKSISEKVVELERKRDDITNFIEFAKTIKLTGRVPTTKEVGSIRYSEFMEYSRELSEIDIDRLESLANLMGDYKEMQYTYTINAYYQILSRMKSLDFNSEAVQAVVEQLFCFLSECDTAKEIGEKYTPVFFSKFTAPFFLEGSDIGEINIATYGREGAEFIARAIAFFGGFDSLDDLYEL